MSEPAEGQFLESERRRATPTGTRRAPDLPPRRLDTPVQLRLDLQERASRTLRGHVVRAVRRFVALVLADWAMLYLMRGVLRWVRDDAALGAWFSANIQAVLPRGILNGWQIAGALLVGLVVTGNYGRGDARRDPKRLFLGCALAAALPLWMAIWTRGLELVMVQYAVTTGLLWVGLVLERRTLDRVVTWMLHPERQAARTLFVGPAEECREAMESPAFSVGGEFRAVGYADTHIPPAPGARGHISEFARVLRDARADTVVVCGYLPDRQFHDVVEAALVAGSQVLSVPRAIEIAGVEPKVMWRRGQAVIELTRPTLKGYQMALKRAMDLLMGVVGLVILAPVFALLAALVKFHSPGPVFFRQVRVGRSGRPFRIFKFRTMVAGAEMQRDELMSQNIYGDPRLFKLPADPRVTRLGRWLRRTSLDELPQLLNVVRGDMSLVGPRPPLPSEVELYEGKHYARFDAKPGITGPWQVSGRNDIRDFEEVVRLEHDYIRNWSLARDIEILLKTVPVVLRMRGAH